MPNFASAFKDEIVRLARKEVRRETEALKKASAHHRSEIAELKRRVASLEKQAASAAKPGRAKASLAASGEPGTSVRFSAKGLATHRQRLGLSAGDMGLLVGVSAQTIYNWEAEKSRPRASQMAAIAAVRQMGKRQCKAKLAELAAQTTA